MTEWEQRIQEYEGESLETFSDGMKIAVLASHAPESIRNVVRLAAGPTSGNNMVVRQNKIFDKDGRGVKSEPSSANGTPMDVVGTRKGMLRVRTSRQFNQGNGKDQGKGKTKSTVTDKNSPAKFEGECRHFGKKGHKWEVCRKRLAEGKDKKVHAVDGPPSNATVAAVEDTGEIDEAGICGCWSDDDDSGIDASEAWF